jgi:hypothetical protein
MVDGWLFEEQLSYNEVSTRCRQEFGIPLTVSSVGRYRRQEQSGRGRKILSGTGPGAAYAGMLDRINEAVLRAAERLELDGDAKALASFANVLTRARQEANQALRASTTREKFEFDAATACLIHQVKMQSIAEDESLDDGQRILKIREELFGPDLPK